MQEIIQVLLENLNAEWQYAGPRRIFGWETSKKGQWDYIVKYVPINKPYLLLQEIIPILGFKKDEADSSFSYKEMNEDIIKYHVPLRERVRNTKKNTRSPRIFRGRQKTVLSQRIQSKCGRRNANIACDSTSRNSAGRNKTGRRVCK